jgi:cyclase
MSTQWRLHLSALTRALVSLLVLFALPARAAEGTDTLEQIIPGHYTYNSNAYVSGIIETSEGLVVVDALYNEAVARRERQAIAATLKEPVRYLISSTFHDNFTKGNVAYPDAIKIGHENYRSDLSDLMKNVPAAERNARLPQVTYRDRMTLNLGGKEIQILHIGRAHTRGDSIVFVPQDRIVYMSELFFYDRFPWMESGYADWINAIDTALKLDADIFVPAHGKMEKDPKASRQALIRFRQILVDARDAVAQEIARGATEAEAVARVQLAQYKDLSGYQQQREVVVRRTYRSLKGVLD